MCFADLRYVCRVGLSLRRAGWSQSWDSILLLATIDNLGKNRRNGRLKAPPVEVDRIQGVLGRRPAMKRGRFHGLRFQRPIRVLPGVHVNLSLSGIGVSVGPR